MFRYINFQSLGVLDQDRALVFYRDVLGLTVHTDTPYEDDWRWIFMEIPGARTKIRLARRADDNPSDMPDLVLVTDDVDSVCDTLRERGIAIEEGPDDAPWNPGTRWAMIRDTENNLILIQTV